MQEASNSTEVCRLYSPHDLRIESEAIGTPGPGQVLVRMAAGGICGSDLHYFHDGGFGQVRVREPIILGHEIAGRIAALGDGVEGLEPGMLVAVNPSHPCGHCKFCLAGQPVHCLDMRFLGSAMRMPHEQGGFRGAMLVGAAQCLPMGDKVTPGEAACTEPLSVCLHALRQAGDVAGRRVLVSGSGPIGVLAVACARLGGAREIVSTDIADAALETAKRMGADRTINVARDAAALEPLRTEKGYFDIAFECSGSPAAIATNISVLKPRARMVQIGLTGEATIPLSLLVAKEIQLCGSQRFHEEFAFAAELIASRRIDVRPMITATYPLRSAEAAFALASDRSRACKVQLELSAEA
jgi:L-idonate 5-dehydrogenase